MSIPDIGTGKPSTSRRIAEQRRVIRPWETLIPLSTSRRVEIQPSASFMLLQRFSERKRSSQVDQGAICIPTY
jgi:hypothetical protein